MTLGNKQMNGTKGMDLRKACLKDEYAAVTLLYDTKEIKQEK